MRPRVRRASLLSAALFVVLQIRISLSYVYLIDDLNHCIHEADAKLRLIHESDNGSDKYFLAKKKRKWVSLGKETRIEIDEGLFYFGEAMMAAGCRHDSRNRSKGYPFCWIETMHFYYAYMHGYPFCWIECMGQNCTGTLSSDSVLLQRWMRQESFVIRNGGNIVLCVQGCVVVKEYCDRYVLI